MEATIIFFKKLRKYKLFLWRISLLRLCLVCLFVAFGVKTSYGSPFANLLEGYERGYVIGGSEVHVLNGDQDDVRIRGVVVDSDTGVPILGANVMEKEDNSNGAYTDMDGNFTLTVSSKSSIVVSYIGYSTQDILVGQLALDELTNLKIKLSPEASSLDETVIVAFGKQKKQDVVGSITTVRPEDLKVPSSNLTTAMAGRIPGMIAYQRSGEPGADNANFFIRGVTSFGYKVDPLIMIDGVESSPNDLARLQTDNIADFSILKDATATALYGSRAANGVILINTKEGKEGKARISVRLENSLSTPTKNLKTADPITYMELANEAVLTRDPLGVLPYGVSQIENTKAGLNPFMFPAIDWRKELMKSSTMNQRANLDISGGGKSARYYFAGSVNRDTGVLKVNGGNNFNNNIELLTYSLRTNVNVDVTKTTELVAKISGTFDDYTGPIQGGENMYYMTMHADPARFPAFYEKDADHEFVEHIMYGNSDFYGDNLLLNPYAQLTKGYKDYSQSTINAQFRVNQDLSFITEGLNLNAMVHTQRYSFFDVSRQYKPFYYQATGYDRQSDLFNLNVLNEDDGEEFLSYEPGEKIARSSFKFESTLNYNRTFEEKHEVASTLVFLAENRITGNSNNLQESLPFRNVGLAGRLRYGFDKRYNVEVNFGYNASERFDRSHRWGFFPSYGASWNVSNEEFWEGIKPVVSNLKLRATYGYSGNDEIGSPTDRFLYLSQVNMNDSDRGARFGFDNGYGRDGISLSRYANPNISWERAVKANFAVDFELFNAINLTAELYTEKRNNILMSRRIPAEMGLSATPRANVGKTSAKGVDIDFNAQKSFMNGLWIQSMANFTFARGKFTAYEEDRYPDAPWRSHVGQPITQTWGYLAERLFVDDIEVANSPHQNFGEYGGGDIKYRDMNGDGQITELDMVPIGYPTTPEIVYGFGVSAGYKGFDFSVFFQGSARSSFFIDAFRTAPFLSANTGNGLERNQLLQAYADSHWSEENQDLYALFPRLSEGSEGTDNNTKTSTWWLRDGSFLRLKQLEVGYTLPKDLSKKLYMENLRIYVNGTNLVNWSKFKLWDVEMGGNGLGYPIQRVFNVGLKLDF